MKWLPFWQPRVVEPRPTREQVIRDVKKALPWFAELDVSEQAWASQMIAATVDRLLFNQRSFAGVK